MDQWKIDLSGDAGFLKLDLSSNGAYVGETSAEFKPSKPFEFFGLYYPIGSIGLFGSRFCAAIPNSLYGYISLYWTRQKTKIEKFIYFCGHKNQCMPKNLVIVESPAKAKTIEKFLGKDFQVESSFGHIVDLPSKELGVDVNNDFKPSYTVSSDKKAVVKKLKELADKAETIWLASDEDREGEAISWHLAEELKLDKSKTKRIVFNSITKSAIQRAIESPRDIDYNLVNA